MYVFWGIWKWAWQNGSTAPPTEHPHIYGEAPHLAFTDPHEIEDGCVSSPDAQKTRSELYEKRNRKPAILDLVLILVIFHNFFFDVLVVQLSSDQLKM